MACVGFVNVAQIRVEGRGLFHYWKCFIKLALVHMISLGIYRINEQELKLESSRYTHETKSYQIPSLRSCGIHFGDEEIIIKKRIWPTFIRGVRPLFGYAKVGSFPSIPATRRAVGYQRCSVHVNHGVLGLETQRLILGGVVPECLQIYTGDYLAKMSV